MTTRTRIPLDQLVNQQGAKALLTATFDFLRKNNISEKTLASYARNYRIRHKPRETLRQYRRLMRAYEDMGVVMSTWFSHPTFLDKSGFPLPLSAATGRHSVLNWSVFPAFKFQNI